jgi:hypothetical protein
MLVRSSVEEGEGNQGQRWETKCPHTHTHTHTHKAFKQAFVAPVTASYTILVTRPGTIRRGSVSVCHVLLETIHWSQPGPLVPALVHC